MALITTLIPAYKVEFFAETLWGLHLQTFKDFRVIISDDSPNEEISELVRGRLAKLVSEMDVTIVRGPRNQRRNHDYLLELWAGETPFLHYNLDDDVLFPTFYERHMSAHRHGEFAMSISARWVSRADGKPLWTPRLPAFVADSQFHAVPLSDEQVFKSTVPRCVNWLGELSNMVLSARGAAFYPKAPAEKVSYFGLLDLGLVLNAACYMPLVYIRDHLSFFRQHALQWTSNRSTPGGRLAHLSLVPFALTAWDEGRISAQEALQAIAITKRECRKVFDKDPVIDQFLAVAERCEPSVERFYEEFNPWWMWFLDQHPGVRRPVAGRQDEPARQLVG